MSDIDWLAVYYVCREGLALKLTTAERKMAVRRMRERMANRNETPNGHQITHDEAGRRCGCDARTILRDLRELPAADKQRCPVCREPMWVVNGIVEAHPDAVHNECPMSGRQVRRGLAAIRPDLYAWAEGVPA